MELFCRRILTLPGHGSKVSRLPLQEEWEEREWCLECQGSKCNENDYLWVKKCDDDIHQRFIYEEIAGSGGGRIKPLTRPDLCWERTRVNAYQLRPCSTNYTQILMGFSQSGRFELHPYGHDKTDPVCKLLNQHHHPKDEEIVRAEFCDIARTYKTNRWIVYEPETSSISSTFPPVIDSGSDACNNRDCTLCEGDCDSDSQCEGSLKCFKRNAPYEPVPGCSGAETREAGKHTFCVMCFIRIIEPRALIHPICFSFASRNGLLL